MKRACILVGDPFCMYHCAMRPKVLALPEGAMNEADTIQHIRHEMTSMPPHAGWLKTLHTSEDLLSRGLSAYGLGRLADEKDERIKLFKEAGRCGISGGYYDAAIIDEKNADELLERAANYGVLGAYEKKAQRLIQKMSTVKQEERNALIPQIVHIYTLMGIRGDEQGYLALARWYLEENRREEAKKVFSACR